MERSSADPGPIRLAWFRRSALGRFYDKLRTDLATRWAVVIAWQLLVSLFPIVLGVLGLFGLLMSDPDRHQALAEGIAAKFPGQFSDLLAFIEHTRQSSTAIGLLSLVGLAWGGYWLFTSMEFVFNRFYGVADRSLPGQARMAVLMTWFYFLAMILVVGAGLNAFLGGYGER